MGSRGGTPCYAELCGFPWRHVDPRGATWSLAASRGGHTCHVERTREPHEIELGHVESHGIMESIWIMQVCVESRGVMWDPGESRRVTRSHVEPRGATPNSVEPRRVILRRGPRAIPPITCNHFHPHRGTWSSTEPRWMTWSHVKSHESMWDHAGARGITRSYVGSRGMTRSRVEPRQLNTTMDT